MKAVALLTMVPAVALLAADPKPPPEIFPMLQVGTNVYRNARILRTTETEAFIKFDGGIVRGRLSDLPPQVQEKYPPTATPDPPSNRTRTRPYRQAPLDVVITNLEVQIGVLERAREKFQTPPGTSENSTPSPNDDPGAATEVQRRLEEIDRNLTRLRADLERYRAIKERLAANIAAMNSNTNSIAATNSAPNTAPKPQFRPNHPAARPYLPYPANRPVYRNGMNFPRTPRAGSQLPR